MLAAQSLTASHYEAVYWVPEQLVAPVDFWVIADTRQSSGGWPSLLGDNSPRDPPHSYESFPYADDLADVYNNGWSPWCPGNSEYSTDFWITCWGWPGCDSRSDLTMDTWGGIKSLF